MYGTVVVKYTLKFNVKVVDCGIVKGSLKESQEVALLSQQVVD